MGPGERASWMDEALQFVLESIAAHDELRDCLVFKGARVLHQRLSQMTRQSLDLDANLSRSTVEGRSSADIASTLELQLSVALEHRVAAQDTIRYQLLSVRVVPNPRELHPRGWQGFNAAIRLSDALQVSQLAIPTLEIDLSAPEQLGAGAVAPLAVGDDFVYAYSAERQAAEKLRAFLQSLPAYRERYGPSLRPLRAKDVADLHAVLKEHPVSEVKFWSTVAAEFRTACEGRLVACAGWESFAVAEGDTREAFRTDAILAKIVSFDAAWASLREIVAALEGRGVFPVEVAGE